MGLALFFYNFSTFLGKCGIYLEDLFVLPEYRGRGYGKGLLQKLAQITVERGCSIDFYLAQGAVPMDEWTIYRLTGDALTDFAGGQRMEV